MEFIKEEIEDIKTAFIKEESEDINIVFIKEESEDMKIEETIMKQEDTEEQTVKEDNSTYTVQSRKSLATPTHPNPASKSSTSLNIGTITATPEFTTAPESIPEPHHKMATIPVPGPQDGCRYA
ncbi:hypothetical protein DPX16_5254 [Anabarilius grahami]|uniref:Uncharacterized protein n=1 Tax=Anabarilius grahami TaxID=495550 RepID=A0A3N0Y294_ANAGA|nr:hypothetical protein DPX16_5254 [Anabarilius grahami]